MSLRGRDIICFSTHYWDEQSFRKQVFMSHSRARTGFLYVEPSFSMARGPSAISDRSPPTGCWHSALSDGLNLYLLKPPRGLPMWTNPRVEQAQLSLVRRARRSCCRAFEVPQCDRVDLSSELLFWDSGTFRIVSSYLTSWTIWPHMAAKHEPRTGPWCALSRVLSSDAISWWSPPPNCRGATDLQPSRSGMSPTVSMRSGFRRTRRTDLLPRTGEPTPLDWVRRNTVSVPRFRTAAVCRTDHRDKSFVLVGPTVASAREPVRRLSCRAQCVPPWRSAGLGDPVVCCSIRRMLEFLSRRPGCR